MAPSQSPSKSVRIALFGVLLQGVILLVGCGGSGKGMTGIPVSGTVTVGGKPLSGARIHFSPDDSKGNSFNKDVNGQLKSDGTYSVSFTDSAGKVVRGAPAGWYKVYFSVEKAMQGGDVKSEEINAMYKDARKSKLEVEVKENAPAGSYDFKLNK
jgi:hypothetical protein